MCKDSVDAGEPTLLVLPSLWLKSTICLHSPRKGLMHPLLAVTADWPGYFLLYFSVIDGNFVQWPFKLFLRGFPPSKSSLSAL